MARQQGWVVNDRAMFRVVNDLHGDELGAEGQDVELCTDSLVLSHHLWDGLTLHSPTGELEDRHTIFLCLCGCRKEGKKESEKLQILHHISEMLVQLSELIFLSYIIFSGFNIVDHCSTSMFLAHSQFFHLALPVGPALLIISAEVRCPFSFGNHEVEVI